MLVVAHVCTPKSFGSAIAVVRPRRLGGGRAGCGSPREPRRSEETAGRVETGRNSTSAHCSSGRCRCYCVVSSLSSPAKAKPYPIWLGRLGCRGRVPLCNLPSCCPPRETCAFGNTHRPSQRKALLPPPHLAWCGRCRVDLVCRVHMHCCGAQVRILRVLQHSNVVCIYQFFKDDPDYYYMVLEYMAGGELFDRIVQKVSACRSASGDCAGSA